MLLNFKHMKKITEVDHLENEWFKKAETQTLETLPEFINHLMNDYEHDYGTIVKATAAAMIATFEVCNKSEQGGLTGFQTGFIPWLMMDKFWGESKVGRKVVDFYDMFYPQYADRFEKTISPETWNDLQKIAKEKMKEPIGNFHPNVRLHISKIAAGEIPFGYKVKSEW